MGSGHQGGSSSAEDGEIRKAFSADKTKTAKDARDFFRDRDSGLTANMAYLDSYAQGTGNPTYGGSTNRDMIERQLGNQGLELEGQNFVRYDEDGNRGTVGGINQRGNFWGSADLSGVRSPSYLAQNADYTGSRARRYGSNAEDMSQGTLDPKIQNSLIDLVTYNPDGTVTGVNSQQVYNKDGIFAGDPNTTYNTNTGLYETDERIGSDDSSPSILGRMARGLTDYIGGGGIMGALSTDSGSGDTTETIKTPEMINLNPGGFNAMKPVRRPTDGISDITSALMGGADSVTKLTNDQLRNLPTYAGGYTGSGANNPFLSADQRGVLNQFNAQGVQVPFDGGNRIDVPLGIGTLPGKKTLSELAKTEPVITAGFRNPTNVFDPRQRIIDDAMRPLGDRVSMYEDDPSIAFGFGGEPFDLSQTSGFTDNQRRFDRGLAPTNISDPQSEVTYIDPTDAYQTPFQRDFTYLGGNDGLLPRRSTSEINRIGVPTQIAPYDASFERENAVRALPDQTFGSLFADQRAADAARDFASGEGSTGAQISETPAYSDDADRLEDLRTTAAVQAPLNQPYGSLFADQRAAQAARDFASGEGSTFGQMSGTPAYSDDADQLEELITTGALQASPSQPFGSLFADQRAAQAARDFYTGEGSTFGQMSGTPAFGSSVPNTIQVSPNADQITDTPTQAFRDENFGIDSDVTDFSFENRTPINRMMYNRPTSEVSEGGGPMSIGDAFKYIGGDLKRIFTEDPAVVARREAAERDENMYGTGMFDLSETYDPSGANNMNMTDDNVNMTDAFKYIGGDIGNIFKESYNNAQNGVSDSVPVPSSIVSNTVQNPDGSASTGTALPSFPAPSVSNTVQNPDGSASTGTLEAVITDARNKRIAKLGTATGSENNQVLEDARTTEYLDPRIRDAMAPDGLDDNMYNDGSEIFDLSETYDPSGGGFTDGGGGGGGFGGCPEGYEPMTLENGETVCVPIEEEVTEEEVEEVTPVTPTVRPTMGPSAYTPQAVSPIRPYTLQPGEQGVGSLADVLQLQNYPNIV